MRPITMPGFRPETDTITTSDQFSWPYGVPMSRVRRGKLVVDLPHTALVEPWADEFLWRPLKLLGVVDAWLSMVRPLGLDHMVECLYQTGGDAPWQFSQHVPRELIADTRAWESFRKQQFRSFLFSYQDALDDRAVGAAS